MSAPPKKRPGVVNRGVADKKLLKLHLSSCDNFATPRYCAACGTEVTNRNLGGHDGRPLSGSLWCLRCEDRPLRRVLFFDRRRGA
jgi:hypothetical protein